MSLTYSGVEPQPSLAWTFESSNVDIVTSLAPSSQVSPGPAQLQGSAALVTNAPTSNTAVYFPGTVNDYMNLGATGPTTFDTTTSNTFVEAWVYFNALAGNSRIYGHYFNPTNNGDYNIRSSGAGLGFTNGSVVVGHQTVMQTGVWTHIAFSLMTNGTANVFVNGVVNSTGGPISVGYTSTHLTLIGGGSGSLTNAYIRDLRVVQGGVVPTGTFTPLASAPFSYASPGYVANMGTTVFTLLGQFVTYNPSGKYGSAVSITNYPVNGSTATSYIRYPLATPISVDNGFTTAFWFKTPKIPITGEGYPIAFNGSAAVYTVYFVYNSTGNIVMVFYDANFKIPPTTSYVTNTWYHIAGTIFNGLVSFYVNGSLIGTAGYVPSGVTVNTQFHVGSAGNYGGADILMDDLRIYNTALTAAQVQSVYSSQGAPAPSRAMPLPKLAWDFNGTNTPYIGSVSSTTVTGTVAYGSGKYMQDVIIRNPINGGFANVITYNLATSIPVDAGVTFTLWVKYLALPASTFGTTTFTMGSIYLGARGPNIWIIGGFLNGSFYDSASVNQTLTTDTWYHMGLTVGFGQISMYFNGVLRKTSAYTLPVTNPLTYARVGADGGYGGDNVEIDDLRIFDRSLTSSQVQSVFNQQGVPGRGVQNTSTYTPTPIATLFGTTFSPLNVRTPAPDTSVAGQTTFTSAAGNYSDQGSIALTPLTTGLTVTIKFKLNTFTVNGGIFCLLNGLTTNYYQLYLNFAQKASVEMTTDSTSIGGTTSGVINTGTIYTFTVVMQNNGYLYLYVDGVLYYSSTTPVTLVNRNYNIYIARERYAGMQSSLTVYDFRVINETLTSDKVLNLYKATTYNILTPKISLTGTPLFSQLSSGATSSAVGAFSLRAVNGTSVKAVQVRPQGQFPATGFTSAVTNPGGNQYNQTLTGYPFGGSGTYTSNCSSWAASDGNQPQPWKAFDNNTNTWWENNYIVQSGYNGIGTGTSNTYSGTFTTIVSGSSVAGEWLQLGLPSAIVLYSYSMYARSFGNSIRMPYKFVISGSNDGITWTTVDSQDGITWSGVTPITFTPTTTTAWSYFRLIVQAIQGNGTANQDVNIGQWSLFGAPPNTNTDFYADRLGNLLTAPVVGQSLANWLGGATGYVATWYDQSGAGNHVSQTVAASQPSITTNGTIVFSGAQSFSNASTTGGCLAASAGTKTKYSYGAVWNPSSLSGYQSICEHNASSGTTSKRSSLLLTTTTLGFNGQSNDIQSLITGLVTGTQYSTVARIDNTDAGYTANGNKNVRMRQNGVDYSGLTTDYTTLNLDNYQFIIGKKANTNGEFFNGSMKSIMVFKDALSDADTALLHAWQQSI